MAFQVDFSTKNVLLLAPKLRKLGGHNAPPLPGHTAFQRPNWIGLRHKHTSRQLLLNDIKSESKDQRFSYDTCLIKFNKKRNLTTQPTLIHNEKVYKCQICSEKFKVALNTYFKN